MMTRLVIRRWRVNELIETLRRQLNKGETTFGDAIVTACQAQRNACLRAYGDNLFDDTYTAIANAEIERCDYE